MAQKGFRGLSMFYGALANAKRLNIIFLVSKEGLTITQLSKAVNLNYTITSEYVTQLASHGLVSKERNPDRTVTVKSCVEIKENGELQFLKS